MARRRITHNNLHIVFLGIVFVCLSTVTLLDLSLLKFDSNGGDGVGPPRVSTGRTIYLVTNTWARPSQMANMVQLAQTLLLVSDLHWVVTEETHSENSMLLQYLLSTQLRFTYLRAPLPSAMGSWPDKPHGVPGRRLALAWIRHNVVRGVVTFSHDHYIYDYRLFDEIRWTKRVSVFPVGDVTRRDVLTPVVRSGRLVSWYGLGDSTHTFPTHYENFAIAVGVFKWRRRANFAWTTQFGEEDIVARLGVKQQNLELMAQQCTKRLDEEQYDDTNLRLLQQYLWRPPDPESLTTATTTATSTPSSNNTNISEEDDYYDSSSLSNSTNYYYDDNDDDDGQNYEY
ncbi:hypothetical protein Pmani_033583 [Petrolisthes manimaculis]|uniref:Galactosylgalactosylxylosylprotein 3-beta-glucuronosyltransferase n=1 Tax=Petrolisthes manimaculis TaxID=1843537 RepID=A0AAE1NQZ1_9EUCA|nr:hypothetical protein Pmani_033583 [Petrolisthes manimaculis]